MADKVYNDSVVVLPLDGADRWPVRVTLENGQRRHGAVSSWDELRALSVELGFDLQAVRWIKPAHDEMTEELGPAPW